MPGCERRGNEIVKTFTREDFAHADHQRHLHAEVQELDQPTQPA